MVATLWNVNSSDEDIVLSKINCLNAITATDDMQVDARVGLCLYGSNSPAADFYRTSNKQIRSIRATPKVCQ